MKTIKRLALWAILALGIAPQLGAAPIPTAPIHTNKLKFRIPFHFDANELARLGAREIRLFASRDRGRSWNQVQAVSPDAGKFNFQAPADGEYWFIVRTLDAKNHLHPDGNVTEPGLEVIVDTTLPRLELELRQPAAGKVQLVWNASDEHLDATQLRLEYMQPGTPDWQPVSVVPKASGQTGWAIPQGGMVAVRGSIADFARNTARDQVQLRIAPANQAVPRQDAPELRQPVAGPGGAPRDSLALTLPDRFPSAARGKDDEPADEQGIGARESAQFARKSAESAAAAAPGPKNSFVSLKPDDRPMIGGQKPAASAAREKPTGEVPARLRVVGARQFQIGYKLQDVGPSGVDSVDLYITQDNGETWYSYGSDDDNKSPMQVEVPREGTYGFALGVRSGAGLSSEPPHPGQRPAIVVVVDQTPPRVELLPPEQGRGKNANKLLISWKCSDENLGEKPVSLFYSATGQAPWNPISEPMENSGSYVWNIGQGVPARFYLRIEARDRAGNLQSIDCRQPVIIDLSRPTAKILDVESPDAAFPPRE